MDAKGTIIEQLDSCLSRLQEDEKAIAARAANLLAATALVVTVMLGLRQLRTGIPLVVVAMYVLLALVSSLTIGGRQLVDPTLNNDLRHQWYNLSVDELQEVLFDAKES